jgi:N,N'-diacetyllegionaminate synthase
MKMKSPIVIAEVGVNHNGNFKLLSKIIEETSKTDVDFIKFQAFIADQTTIKNSPKAKYQNKVKMSQYDMLKKYELKSKHFDIIYKKCSENNLKPLFSVFDIESLNNLKKYKIKNIKIPSGEITNLPLIKKVGKMKINVFLSTGMSTIKEIKKALLTLTNNGTPRKKIYLFHCHSDYPSKIDDLNLLNILTFKKTFNCKIGFSDHTIGELASIVAVSIGAEVIEKHITLSNKYYGPDHSSSLEVKKLNNFVQNLRNIKKTLGTNSKLKRSIAEIQNKKIVRKSIVAKKEIKKGEFFSEKNITCKRPGIGISPIFYESFLGKKSKYKFKKDQFIKFK